MNKIKNADKKLGVNPPPRKNSEMVPIRKIPTVSIKVSTPKTLVAKKSWWLARREIPVAKKIMTREYRAAGLPRNIKSRIIGTVNNALIHHVMNFRRSLSVSIKSVSSTSKVYRLAWSNL
jgi:hypothetical protein